MPGSVHGSFSGVNQIHKKQKSCRHPREEKDRTKIASNQQQVSFKKMAAIEYSKFLTIFFQTAYLHLLKKCNCKEKQVR